MRRSNYEAKEMVQNILYIIKSKIFYPGSRMIRFPIVVRGKNT